MSTGESADFDPEGRAQFQTTHWSIVLAASHRSSVSSREALSDLGRKYWYPLYAYAHRRADTVQLAQDLTQEFFARLLEKNDLVSADPERGRFRAFLLGSFKHFLANEWDKARAQKRGGGHRQIPWNFDTDKFSHCLEQAEEMTPDRLYERQWALTLLDQTLSRLRDEFVEEGKEAHFEQLKVFITGDRPTSTHAQVARELGMTEGAVKVAAHRLRRRYRNLLQAEVAQTVAAPEEVDDEIRSLFTILGS